MTRGHNIYLTSNSLTFNYRHITSVLSKLIFKRITFCIKLHGITFSLRPDEACQ